MTNPLITQCEETLKEFDSLHFDFGKVGCIFLENGNIAGPEYIRNFILSRFISLWESEVVRTKNKLYQREITEDSMINPAVDRAWWDGVKVATDSILEPYKSAIEWAKEQIK